MGAAAKGRKRNKQKQIHMIWSNQLIKRVIRAVLNKFGFEIVKMDKGLPSNQILFENFSSIVTAYEKIFQQNEKITFRNNPLRTTLLARGKGTRPPEAFFIIKAIERTQNVNGDVCEFGVAQGETSALIANEIHNSNKILHLFDSFEGLPNPTPNDSLINDVFSLGDMSSYQGTMAFPKIQVESRLQAINFPAQQYIIHEGFIEQTLKIDNRLPKKVSFAYVDLDLFEPIRIALDFLDSRTEQGSIIIIDDYDFFSTGVKKAVDDFINTHPQYQIQIPHKDFGYFAILEKMPQ